ncbi:MAG: hypothetical protein ACYDGR_14420 [Candidatus Dormibacteria bacterium]
MIDRNTAWSAVVAAAAAMMAALMLPLAGLAGNSVSRTYYTPAGEVFPGVTYNGQLVVAPTYGVPPTDPCGSNDPGVGGACLLVSGGGMIDIVVADKNTSAVAAQYAFRDNANNAQGGNRNLFCGKVSAVKVPPKATQVVVTVGAVKYDTIGTGTQLVCGAPAPGTTGTITITGSLGANAMAMPAPTATRRTATATAHRAAQPVTVSHGHRPVAL